MHITFQHCMDCGVQFSSHAYLALSSSTSSNLSLALLCSGRRCSQKGSQSTWRCPPREAWLRSPGPCLAWRWTRRTRRSPTRWSPRRAKVRSELPGTRRELPALSTANVRNEHAKSFLQLYKTLRYGEHDLKHPRRASPFSCMIPSVPRSVRLLGCLEF